MKRNEGIITFLGNPMTLVGEMVKVGDVAKDFTVVNNDLQAVKLSDFKGKTVILSIAPSIDTGVCAAQTRRFNVEAAKLNNINILSITVDLPFALKRFCGAEGIDQVVTLSDYQNRDFGTTYGFLIDELKLNSRGIVIVDKNGMVQYVEYVKEVTNHPDYDAALACAQEIA